MEFVGYKIRDTLISTSGEDNRNTNTTRKQGIQKSIINRKSPSATLGF